METGSELNQEVITQNAEGEQTEQAEAKTFTQEDVNHIVAKRVAKYSDYEELKQKAAKYDEQIEAGKSDLQKATERAESLQAELDAIKSANELKSMREEVAKAKGVPVTLLTGTDPDECEAQADALLKWAKPKGYPKVPDGGDPIGHAKKTTREMFAEWFNENV